MHVYIYRDECMLIKNTLHMQGSSITYQQAEPRFLSTSPHHLVILDGRTRSESLDVASQPCANREANRWMLVDVVPSIICAMIVQSGFDFHGDDSCTFPVLRWYSVLTKWPVREYCAVAVTSTCRWHAAGSTCVRSWSLIEEYVAFGCLHMISSHIWHCKTPKNS